MSIFDWLRSSKRAKPTPVPTATPEPTASAVPPAGIWIRAKLHESMLTPSVIAFTYDDPAAGRSAKGGADQKGMQTEITIRFPGGCVAWETLTPIQVRDELTLPVSPEWMRAMKEVPVNQAPSTGVLPTTFDLAVDRYLVRVREARTECGDLTERGVALWRKHDLEGAMALFQKAHAVAEKADDRYSLANALGNEALIVSACDPAAALKIFTTQEALWRELGPRVRPNLAVALRNEIACLMKMGDVASASRKLDEVESLAQLLRDKELVEWTNSTKLSLREPKSERDRPWRHDANLRGLLSEEYPDDLLVEFKDPSGSQIEGMWVRIQGIEKDTYYGALLNEPRFLKSVRCGDIVLFRKEPQDAYPKFRRKRG